MTLMRTWIKISQIISSIFFLEMLRGNKSCLEDLHTQLHQMVPQSLSNIRISILLHFFLYPRLNSSPMTYSTSAFFFCLLTRHLPLLYLLITCFSNMQIITNLHILPVFIKGCIKTISVLGFTNTLSLMHQNKYIQIV